MKTLSDVKHYYNNFLFETNKKREEFRQDFFDAYRKEPRVQSFLDKVNKSDVDGYFFDEAGMLCGYHDLPPVFFNEAEFPFLADFLEGSAEGMGLHYDDKEDKIVTCQGYAITVRSHGNQITVEDHEEKVTILYNFPMTNVPMDYVQAKIELHMRKTGCFPDVVVIDYYGEYMRQFNCTMGDKTDEELRKIVDDIENEMKELC